MITVSEEGDAALTGGTLDCPSCPGTLRPWGSARLRQIRTGGATAWIRPRRARCAACCRTQVLLPCRLLNRRRDAVADVGAVLEAYARGAGYRRVARELAIPLPTVRNWVRRLRGRWARLRLRFIPQPAPTSAPASGPASASASDDPLATVVAIERAADLAGWSLRRWDFASLSTNGDLLATNTT
jgi:hypothetical protein